VHSRGGSIAFWGGSFLGGCFFGLADFGVFGADDFFGLGFVFGSLWLPMLLVVLFLLLLLLRLVDLDLELEAACPAVGLVLFEGGIVGMIIIYVAC